MHRNIESLCCTPGTKSDVGQFYLDSKTICRHWEEMHQDANHDYP